MQCVPEFVERRDDLVDGHQRRFALGRFGDIEVVRHHRLLVFQVRLADVGVHPGAAAFGLSRIGVEDEQAQRGSIVIEYLEDAYVLLVDGQIEAFLERDPEHLGCREEDAVLEHAVQLKVGLELRGVELESLLPDLVRIEVPVPGRQFEVAALRVDHGLQIGRLALGIGDGRRGQ